MVYSHANNPPDKLEIVQMVLHIAPRSRVDLQCIVITGIICIYNNHSRKTENY